MIPLRDNISHYKKPVVTVSLIIINVLVFFYWIIFDGSKEFVYTYGFIPKILFLPGIDLLYKVKSLFTSMFLHGSFAHLFGNMLFLWIFADNVEDRLGHMRFLLFYLLCGLGATFTHFLMNIGSEIPAIGASGAIAGVLGAYMVMFPNARIATLIPFFFFWQIVEIPAFIYLGLWFIYQFFFGVTYLGGIGVGIAFWAHIGGFITGILLRWSLFNSNWDFSYQDYYYNE